jgi:hypothetical protein
MLIGRIVVENYETNLVDRQHITLDADLALNFSKVIGMDFGGSYQKDNDWKTEVKSTASDFYAGLRIGVLNLESFRLIGSAEYERCKQVESTENLQFTAHVIVKLTHHFALMGIFKQSNIWQRELGMLEIDPHSYFFGGTITARL